jgi:hypothetical protein
MPIRIVADKQDELPEGLREFAKLEGSVYVVAAVSMPEGWALENVRALKDSVIAARTERDDAKRSLKAFDGLDAAKAGDAREALEQLTAGKLRGSKEIDEYKQSIERKFAEDRTKLETRLSARTALLREQMTRGQLSPIIAAKGGSDSMDAILTLAAAHVRLDEADDGQVKACLVDRAGKQMVTTKAGSAEPMTYEEFVEQMRDAPATRGLFRLTATGGSGGSSQSGGAGRAVGQQDVSHMSATELIRLGNAKGAKGR